MKRNSTCQLRARRLNPSDIARIFRSMDGRYWLRALLISAGTALIIGLPTVLIPNRIFARMIPTRPIDYWVFYISVILIGLTWALPRQTVRAPSERRSIIAGFGTLLAVGCPTCNKIVLLLLGTTGAMTYFAPIQPFLGAAAVALAAIALYYRLQRVPQAGAPPAVNVPQIHETSH